MLHIVHDILCLLVVILVLDRLSSFHMKCQRQLLQIKWHRFIWNDEISVTTSLSRPSPRPSAVVAMPSSATWPGCQTTSRLTWHSAAKSTYLWADHQAASGIAIPAVLGWPDLDRQQLWISGSLLSVVVTVEWCYGPCWLSDDNK